MNIFDANIDGGKVMFRGTVIGKATAEDDYLKLAIRPEHLARDNKAVLALALQIAEPLGAIHCFMAGWQAASSRLP